MTLDNWHFSLSDGTTTLRFLCSDPAGRERSLRHWTRQPLERTAMKLGSGRTRYDDLVPPWYAVAQDDFSGGRGALNLLDDPTRYADAHGVQTWVPKRLVLGPDIHTDFSGAVNIEHDPDYTVDQMPLSVSPLAQTFTVTRRMTVSTVEIFLSLLNYNGNVVVQLWPLDGSGYPALLPPPIAEQTKALNVGLDERWESFSLPCTLAPGQYAIVVYGYSTGGGLCYHPAETYAGGAPYYWAADHWASTGHPDFLFRIITTYSAPEAARVRFYHVNGLLHAVFSGEFTNVVYRRGILGQSTGAGGDYTLLDSSASFSTLEQGYQMVTLISGTGAGQRRTITSVTSTSLTVSVRWDVKPDASTVYAITGDWHSVGTVSGTIRDVLVVDGVTYFARGAEANLHRHRWTDAGGEQFADDSTNKADRLLLFRDSANDPAVWRALGSEVSAAPLVDWGVNLTFGTAERVGSEDSRITSLVVYDDHLYIGKEDGLWCIQEDVVRQIPVHFDTLRSEDNCRAMVAWNLYLIFPLLNSLQRMYGSSVDDFGPNTGRGLPAGRQGPVSAILPLPGLLVVAIDAGTQGYSSVMCYNSLGWHEIARSTLLGARITALGYEVLDDHARLWWNEGPQLYYVWMSRTTFDRSLDEDVDYTESGSITLAWMGADLEDVDKVWSKAVIIKEQDLTVEGVAEVGLEYRVDDENGSWITATATSESDTRDEFSLLNVVGRRLQLRLTLSRGGDSLYGYTTPEITAVSVDALGRISVGHGYNTHAILDTIAVSLQGQQERVAPATALTTLDGWAGSPTPLTLRHALPEFDNRTVLLEPVGWSMPEYAADGEVGPRVVALTMVEM